MSDIRSEINDLRFEVSELFKLAEQKIKLIEHLDGGLPFPPVNQLRYVAFHLLRAESTDDPNAQRDELKKSKNHCQRAIYDAVEVGIMHYLEQLKVFKVDYQTVGITGVIPNYLEFIQIANEAQDFISTITRDSISDHCNNRGDQYSESTRIFKILRDNNAVLEAARIELDKKLDRNRKSFFLTMSGIIIAITGVIVAIYFGMKPPPISQ